MADLNDLGYKSLTDMETDEAIEMLRQIRLSRRIPVKKVSKITKKKKTVSKVSTNQAEELLKILTGGN
jgi:hypothetical protein